MKILKYLVGFLTCTIPLLLIGVTFLILLMSTFGYDTPSSTNYFDGVLNDILGMLGFIVHIGSAFVVAAMCLYVEIKNLYAIGAHRYKDAIKLTVLNILLMPAYLIFLFIIVQINSAI